jgi:hypothetical protein
MLSYFLAISDAFNILLKLLKLVTLTFDPHHKSPNGKDALVHEDHFPVKFLKITQLE